ncbi:hypothetical protein Hanom_Chr09g00820241 [Helianthus anomalus]
MRFLDPFSRTLMLVFDVFRLHVNAAHHPFFYLQKQTTQLKPFCNIGLSYQLIFYSFSLFKAHI